MSFILWVIQTGLGSRSYCYSKEIRCVMNYRIIEISSLSENQLNEVLAQSKQEGFRFIERLINEYEAGTNRFEQIGEILLGCYDETKLVGICGLNRQAMEGDLSIGRIRRFYVLPQYRRTGIGRLLIESLLSYAIGHFNKLVLKTDTVAASRFYESVGFLRVNNNEEITHYIDVDKISSQEAKSATRQGDHFV